MKCTSIALLLAAGLVATALAPVVAGEPARVSPAVPTPAQAAPAASGRTPMLQTAAAQQDAIEAAATIEFLGLKVDCLPAEPDKPQRTGVWVTYKNNTPEQKRALFAFSAYFLEPAPRPDPDPTKNNGTFEEYVAAGEEKEFVFSVAGGATYRFWDLSIAGAETNMMFATYDCAKGAAFTDSDYFSDQFGMQIEWMFHEGISTGWPEADGTRTYRGLQPIARDAMAAFLYRLHGSPEYTPPTEATFTDVAVGTQFFKEIEWLASVGVTTGWTLDNGDKQFRPLEPVNRDAMAAFLYRFSVLESFPEYTADPDATTFVDVPPGTEHFDAIMWMRDSEISTGWETPDGAEYRPVTPVARDAIAAFVFRYTDHTAYGPKA